MKLKELITLVEGVPSEPIGEFLATQVENLGGLATAGKVKIASDSKINFGSGYIVINDDKSVTIKVTDNENQNVALHKILKELSSYKYIKSLPNTDANAFGVTIGKKIMRPSVAVNLDGETAITGKGTYSLPGDIADLPAYDSQNPWGN